MYKYYIYERVGLMQTITITTEYITLGQFLKFTNLAMSGGEIKAILETRSIKVDGEPENRRGRKLYPDMIVEIEDAGRFQINR